MIAKALTQRMAATKRVRSKDAIYTIVSDEHNLHCLTEGMIDAWWASLPPERKAIFFEADLDGLLYETAIASPEVPAFQAFVDQFFDDMKQQNGNPLAGLMQEDN